MPAFPDDDVTATQPVIVATSSTQESNVTAPWKDIRASPTALYGAAMRSLEDFGSSSTNTGTNLTAPQKALDASPDAPKII